MSEDGEPLAADAEPTTEAPEDGSLDADAELLLAASEEDAPEAEDEDELDEVELDGKKVSVPYRPKKKRLKNALRYGVWSKESWQMLELWIARLSNTRPSLSSNGVNYARKIATDMMTRGPTTAC